MSKPITINSFSLDYFYIYSIFMRSSDLYIYFKAQMSERVALIPCELITLHVRNMNIDHKGCAD